MKKLISITFIVLFFSFCNQNPEKKPISKQVKIEFRLASDSLSEGFEEKLLEGKPVYLNPKVELSEKDVAFASKSKDPSGYSGLLMELNAEGTKKFGTLTANNIQKKLAILVNGNLVMSPIIQSEIPGGKIQISGSFTENEIDSLFKSMTENH